MALGIVLISGFFIWYSFQMIEELKAATRLQVEKYVKLWQVTINSPEGGAELQFIFEEIIVKATFPIIVIDTRDEPVQWRNVPGIADDDTTKASQLRLREIAAAMQAENRSFPIYYGTTLINHLCFGDPEIVEKLQWMPFIEIGVVIAFLLVGLIGLQNIQKSEERLIWVGMAKETAHQLGTPTTSLLGWLELLQPDHRRTLDRDGLDSLLDSTTENMQADTERLQRVANRFGLIGSIPELKAVDLNSVISDAVHYYRRRLPFEGKGIQLDFTPETLPPVRLNTELFGWVFENLIKNALQAVDPRSGRILLSAVSTADRQSVIIDMTDNGSGIPSGAARKIFRPGFTTRKRGWGMGLTLVKRIVEEYHGGKIFLKRSRPGETVFTILLPVAPQAEQK